MQRGVWCGGIPNEENGAHCVERLQAGDGKRSFPEESDECEAVS